MENKIIKNKIILVIVFITIILSAMPVEAQEFLTKEEENYINNRNPIKAVSVDGGAPIQYMGSDGDLKGISKEVLEEISRLTGLSFEHSLYKTVEEVFSSDADIVFGLPAQYAPEGMVLSQPYLRSETILYMNSGVNPDNLDDRIYAATKGSPLPEGIREENSIYFDSREESLDAVESGRADYGFGNAYSLSFYTIQNNYKNIITVPQTKESRAYSIGFLNDDEILISIINKSIASIDETRLNTLILNVTTQIDRNVTIPMIMDRYGLEILVGSLLIISVLLVSFIYNLKSKKELKYQYERYRIISQTSNEYLYEYHVDDEYLELSESCKELFGDKPQLSQLKVLLDQALYKSQKNTPIVELPTAQGSKGLFKSVNSPVYNRNGKVHSIIGKLIDVSEEEAERQELLKKSQIDELTGLYNASTTKDLVTERIINASPKDKDALILIDADKFKEVNDRYGHLEGNKVLANIGKALSLSFRKTDIIGRIGGDEFCIYMKDISSKEDVISKCKELIELVGKLNKKDITISIGIAFLEDEKTYSDLFKKADKALYQSKENGGNQKSIIS